MQFHPSPCLLGTTVQWALISVTLILFEKNVGKRRKFPQTPLNICSGSCKCCFFQHFSVFLIKSFIINWHLISRGFYFFSLVLLYVWHFLIKVKKNLLMNKIYSVLVCNLRFFYYNLKFHLRCERLWDLIFWNISHETDCGPWWNISVIWQMGQNRSINTGETSDAIDLHNIYSFRCLLSSLSSLSVAQKQP